LETAERLLHTLNRLVDRIVCIVLVLSLLYGGYALWDNYMIYKGTDLDSQIAKYKPTPSNPNLSELQAINKDVCAWLTIDDTHIDYPVLHSTDNSRYLNCDIYGKYSLGGSIFLDYRNSPDFSDGYSILYGHHMSGGAMFGDIMKFEDASYFEQHRYGTLIVTGKTYRLELFAVLHEDAYTSPMFDMAGGEGTSGERLAYIRQSALHLRESDSTQEYHILAMSTCASATTNGRTIVTAWMEEERDAGGDEQ